MSRLLLLFFIFSKTIFAFESSPQPKIEEFSFILPYNTFLENDKDIYQKYQASFESLMYTIKRYKSKQNNSDKFKILFNKSLKGISSKYLTYLKQKESYLIDIQENKIEIISNDDSGLLNGLSTLESLIEKNRGVLSFGKIVDYPDLKRRVLHISMWPCSVKDFKSMIRLARLNHFNTLIWLNHYGIALKSLQHLKIRNKNRWDIDIFKKMVMFVKQNGLEIIPELKLLSHQKKFLANSHPEFLYNKATYDPQKKELYAKVVFPAIDELLKLTGATKFHIGHDEVVGWSLQHYKKNILSIGEKQLPPELFLKDVLTLHKYLQTKGIETWMWSDMLYIKKDFPSMKNAGANLNGMNGYSSILEAIPKDIVMNIWHYRGNQKNFPTAKFLLDKGHRILGATWKFNETTKNYARYIHSLNNKKVLGMISTIWYGFSGDRQQEVKEIIKFSGKVFWNAK